MEKGVGPVRLSSLSESVSHGLNGGKGNDVTRKQRPLASILPARSAPGLRPGSSVLPTFVFSYLG